MPLLCDWLIESRENPTLRLYPSLYSSLHLVCIGYCVICGQLAVQVVSCQACMINSLAYIVNVVSLSYIKVTLYKVIIMHITLHIGYRGQW